MPPIEAPDRPVLAISPKAAADNWRVVAARARGAEAGGVLKADGYGLGAALIGAALKGAGCATFFIATIDEGVSLRAALGAGPRIFVLNGIAPGCAPAFAAAALTPVLNTLDEAREWAAAFPRAPAALQFDTGMNRAGLTPDELSALTSDRALLAALNLTLVMSHLACADDPSHPQNAAQLSRFRDGLARLPAAPASLAASSGVFLDAAYHFDLVRPGLALYGANPTPGAPNPMRAVAALTAHVMGVRVMAAGEAAGYGATFSRGAPTRLALCNIGYADGLHRALSSKGAAFIDGVACPYAGRVSMDLLIIDVSALAEGALRRGTPVEIVGPHMTLEDMAARAGTVNYEILTSFGARYRRVCEQG